MENVAPVLTLTDTPSTQLAAKTERALTSLRASTREERPAPPENRREASRRRWIGSPGCSCLSVSFGAELLFDRHRRPEIVIFESEIADEAAARAMESLDPLTEQMELEQRIAEVLRNLPQLHVSILTPRHIAGLSLQEIARTLDIRPAKKYLFCALAQCRGQIDAPS